MNNLRSLKVFIIFILTIFVSEKGFSQTTILENKDEETINLLLERKMSQNNQFSLYTNYSIQLKNGLKDEVETLYKNFIADYPSIDATIIFANPKFKLVVGNYKNKIEAEHLLKKIEKKYPDAFVVKLKQ
ncbi:SPOR domain-containing protein [Flavobacterium sp. xlx-214]|uniref:SPOR domain-containing protein n=1 Tax=unclassified Flavobacterium TaxID=196869 RepID=UPI0013CFB512|nr:MULTISPECIES: SPOR domain-containing protein [unclassified Flavobacterium]MBA5793844.1 SPOR domain-containing protein [Flavobacterium sp. xlx-221]QMI84854.1 SPOR domain-containing protein [Flavobacterium sp. xlx-214]